MNKARTFVRPLTAGERQALEKGRKSAHAFTARRSQILLASAGRMGPAEVGRVIGCTAQAVRNAIRAFEADGLASLRAKSHARHDPGRVWDRDRDGDLKDLLHRRPRGFGKGTSLWTLALVAEVCHEKGWTPRELSVEAIRRALKRLRIGWQRAKHWITSPDPEYAKKKTRPADVTGGACFPGPGGRRPGPGGIAAVRPAAPDAPQVRLATAPTRPDPPPPGPRP
jgi:hypothetical protein